MGCVTLVPLVDRTPFGWLPRDYIIIYNDIIKKTNNIVIPDGGGGAVECF